MIRRATESGVDPKRADDLVVAVNELATNSLEHGGGRGRLRMWNQGREFVCEVSDAGRFDDPLVGRIPPPESGEGGRGFWLATQLCDLIQVRSFASGSVVRLHVRGA